MHNNKILNTKEVSGYICLAMKEVHPGEEFRPDTYPNGQWAVRKNSKENLYSSVVAYYMDNAWYLKSNFPVRLDFMSHESVIEQIKLTKFYYLRN